ncbi:MAG: 50S ribosomal protein L11 methyltransferase [Pseudomonadota bacterium]
MTCPAPDNIDPARFVRDQTRPRPVPLAPEITLAVADEAVALWHKTEEELSAQGLPPPFWAFAWAGGQALSRHVLDHPDLVSGKRVLDLGAGSGLVAVAAAKAGAASVTANDIDRFAEAAIALNATLNNVSVTAETRDRLDDAEPGADVVLVGDVFYERDTADRLYAFLDRSLEAGADVLIGDPGRSYLPKDRLTPLARFGVPDIGALEDHDIKDTRVWRWS